MVFRVAGTYMRKDGHVFGVGSRHGTEEQLQNAIQKERVVPTNMETLRRELVKGFRLENRCAHDVRTQAYQKVINESI